ncbi:MAG: hypothetical protein M1818_006035 [Claussenomyces sp. TS43310]|nr:MAG: hypothetical protein M1818_006035 [Claussenomyces sp. TS43310]
MPLTVAGYVIVSLLAQRDMGWRSLLILSRSSTSQQSFKLINRAFDGYTKENSRDKSLGSSTETGLSWSTSGRRPSSVIRGSRLSTPRSARPMVTTSTTMLSSRLNSTRKDADEDTVRCEEGSCGSASPKSPSRARSLSDSTPPVLSPSPKFREPKKRTKDDTSIEGPSTPRRPAFTARGLSLQMPPGDLMSAASMHGPLPLSPKLDHSNTYGSSPNAIPRRSRGLDFSRAATNLHHSTLAEQPSPESSPIMTGRGMNIPPRRNGPFGSVDMPNGNASSLWSTMTNADRMNVSSSLGSVNMMASSSESSSDDDALMEADEIDDSIITTPQIQRNTGAFGTVQSSPGNAWMAGPSPAVSSLMNFQKARMRHGKNRKGSSSGSGSSINSPKSRSPPAMRSIEGKNSGYFGKELQNGLHSRRESITWAANRLNISGSESDDGNLKSTLEKADPSTPGRDGQRGVIKRAVTRRGNMLPKTKGFARIRAALAEENTPVETEVRREADVIRQVRESDPDLEPSRHASTTGTFTAHSSPSIGPTMDPLEDIAEDMLADPSTISSENQTSSSFKQQALRNSKGKHFWESFPEDNQRTPPPPAFLQRGSTSGISEDVSMDSPSLSTSASQSGGSGFTFPLLEAQDNPNASAPPTRSSTPQPGQPSVAEITRKVNNKRRRDDDFDPTSFKRRAVSPGMSVHNSPVMQSPLQRDGNPWGFRPAGSGGAAAAATSAGLGPDKATAPASAGSSDSGVSGRVSGTKRIGFQGMVDTNDGLMKMSIE